MNGQLMMALMPILVLSLTAVVLMIQASVKRDQAVAWWITALGFLLALWGAGYAREFTQPVTVLLMVDDWGLFFTTLILVASLVTLDSFERYFFSRGRAQRGILSAAGAHRVGCSDADTVQPYGVAAIGYGADGRGAVWHDRLS